jgi:hypothetical protein
VFPRAGEDFQRKRSARAGPSAGNFKPDGTKELILQKNKKSDIVCKCGYGNQTNEKGAEK